MYVKLHVILTVSMLYLVLFNNNNIQERKEK